MGSHLRFWLLVLIMIAAMYHAVVAANARTMLKGRIYPAVSPTTAAPRDDTTTAATRPASSPPASPPVSPRR